MLPSADDFLAAASRTTGLSDFGPRHFYAGLKILLASLTSEARLKEEALPRIRSMIFELLQKRLYLNDWLDKNPEIHHEHIKKPLIIVGFPRSGSSILHELMALDQRNRCPLAWEVAKPLPPPRRNTYHCDRRIAELQQEFDRQPWPGLATVTYHRIGASLPAEDMEITKLDFANHPSIRYYVPSFTRYVLEEIDYTPVYHWLSTFLRLLQSQCPGSPWVLKSLNSTNFIPKLLGEYPDARVIWLHRDPVAATLSAAHLIQVAASGHWNDVTPVERAEDVARWRMAQADAAVRVSQLGLIPDAQRIDIYFDELNADEVGTVRRIYEYYGLEWTDELGGKMSEYLLANSRATVSHKYMAADIGLNVGDLRARFDGYVRHFSIPLCDRAGNADAYA